MPITTSTSSQSLTPEESLVQFRQILFEQGILHDGDSIGTDDNTLAWVNLQRWVYPVVYTTYNYSRFLRARKYNLKDATKMFRDCQHWRKTVEGVGLDELYRTLDPFDVRIPKPYCFGGNWKWINSTLNVKKCTRAGLCGSIKCVSHN